MSHVCDKIANDVVALTAFIAFQGFVIASLIALVMLLTINPERQQRLRRWAQRLPWAS